MKRAFSLGIVTIFLGSLFLCSALLAEEKEIPITTSSKDALKSFLEGRDKWEFAESDAAAKLFDQAILKIAGVGSKFQILDIRQYARFR